MLPNTLIKCALVVSSLLFTNIASAKEKPFSYFGLAFGSAEQVHNNDEFTIEDSDDVFTITLGYNPGWSDIVDIALETSFVDFGKVALTNTDRIGSSELSGMTSAFVVGKDWGSTGLYAKAGVFFWDEDASANGVNLDGSGREFFTAVGLRLQVLPTMALRLEHEFFETDNTDVEVTNLGLFWSF